MQKWRINFIINLHVPIIKLQLSMYGQSYLINIVAHIVYVNFMGL